MTYILTYDTYSTGINLTITSDIYIQSRLVAIKGTAFNLNLCQVA